MIPCTKKESNICWTLSGSGADEARALNFETGDGIRIAEGYGMSERTFKRWLNSSLFKKIDHGYYEKKYR